MAGSSISVAHAPITLASATARTRVWSGWIASGGLCALFVLGLTALAVAQHDAYSTGRQDLEIYVQVIWNTAHGRLYESTLLKTNRSHLAEHLSGAVLLLAPLYKLFPAPALLIGIQQLCLGLAGLPIFAATRRWTGSTGLALLLTTGYLSSSALSSIALDDFHPVTLTALPLATAAYCLLTGRRRAALALAVLAMFLEEEAALIVAGLGLMLLARRQWRAGLGWFSLGTAYLALAIFVVMPRFHLPQTMPDGAPNRSVGHFRELLTRPTVLTDRLFGERGRDAATQLLLPTAGLAILEPRMLLANLPSFTALFLQDRDDTFSRHWAAPMLPLLWLATAAGLGRISSGHLRFAASLVIVAGGVAGYRLASPLPGGGDYEPERFERTERSEILDDLVSRVPPDARVAASVNIVAHLAHRPGVYVFPPGDHYASGLERQARRPNAYVLDLFDSGTQRIAALDRLSPLLVEPAYTVWSPGHKAVLLLDTPPAPPGGHTATYDDKILLRGSSVRATSRGQELELQWQKYQPIRGRYVRQITVIDDRGRVIDRQDDMPLGSVFGLNKWLLGQVIVDTYRVQPPAGSGPLVARVAWVARDKQIPIEVSDGSRFVEIPLTPR